MSSRRSVLAAFALLVVLAGLGLLFWGPLPVAAATHQYADARAWLGVPNSANVLINLPTFWLAVWGWCATRTSPWPPQWRLPWQWFHLFVMAAALSSAMYHAAPSDDLFVVSHTCMAGAFVMLSLGLLVERVGVRFGSVGICTCATLVVALIGVWTAGLGQPGGAIDLRPLLLLELMPVLLIPAGVLRMPGLHGRNSGWLLALVLYASSRLLEWADAAIFQATACISGHTLMHAVMTLVVGWTTYRAAVIPNPGASEPAAGMLTQRKTSLNTPG